MSHRRAAINWIRGGGGHEALEMLVPRPRRHDAPSGGKKVSPRHARSRESLACFTALLHGIIISREGFPQYETGDHTLVRCRQCTIPRRRLLGDSSSKGRPYGGRSPLNASNRLSIKYGRIRAEKTECRRCTVPSGYTPNRARRFSPGT